MLGFGTCRTSLSVNIQLLHAMTEKKVICDFYFLVLSTQGLYEENAIDSLIM